MEMTHSDDNKFSQSSKRAWRNPWVIGWIGLVVVVLGVNITMITLAVTTNPGLVNDEYYERGRTFERRFHQRLQERNTLGWQSNLDLPQPITLGSVQAYRFHVTDQVGQPLQHAEVQFSAYRPADATADFVRPLMETAPGRYEAEFAFPLKGLWDVIVHVRQGDKSYDVARRINVQG